MKVKDVLNLQRDYFLTGKSKLLLERKTALEKLGKIIRENEDEIFQALKLDLGKAQMESYLTEIAVVQDEIKYSLRHMTKWARPKRVKTPVTHFPSKSYLYSEPKGVVLILSPWNYPFQLCMAPLVGAIAAGNCVILKPSKNSGHVSALMAKMINENFDIGFLYCLGIQEDSYDEILGENYDHIFFTGSENVGKKVMEAASKYLTPVTLELGGKSPCIVDETANIKVTAKRLAWGKFLNAGQTCVAPDYVLVQQSVKEALISELQKNIIGMYGEEPCKNKDFPKIINHQHFDRLTKLIKEERDKIGGAYESETLKIAPTLFTNADFQSEIMRAEIFGPILPILVYENLEDVIRNLQRKPKPLALYLFTTDKKRERQMIETLSYGGGCINDTVVHLANHHLPFGGVGSSGMGGYHGEYSFALFSHKKSILKKGLWLDVPIRYAPYEEKAYQISRKMMK